MNIIKLQDIKSTQKSLAFLYTNNEKTERDSKALRAEGEKRGKE